MAEAFRTSEQSENDHEIGQQVQQVVEALPDSAISIYLLSLDSDQLRSLDYYLNFVGISIFALQVLEKEQQEGAVALIKEVISSVQNPDNARSAAKKLNDFLQ